MVSFKVSCCVLLGALLSGSQFGINCSLFSF